MKVVSSQESGFREKVPFPSYCLLAPNSWYGGEIKWCH